ncbi:MAG: transporter substrate-binding domain-containing protein [Deltaproteobacteria bacterium]|nr:transporter substrate-binding domain-containing protein [Deltaproteobacteria bacterium]
MRKSIFIAALVSLLVLSFVASAPAGDILNRIIKNGELVVGTTGSQPPLNATSKDGEIIGLDADIARLIAGGMDVKVRFKSMPFAELLPALHADKVDLIISSMTMTPKRNLKVAFIGPYYISGKGMLTKTQTIATLQAAEGLNNSKIKIAALKASTSQAFVEGTAPQAKLMTAKSYDEALGLLFDDKVDVLIADYPYCAFTAFRHQEKGLVAGQSRLTFEPLGIAVKEDTLLINWLSNYMKMLEGSGQLSMLNDRWFKNSSWIKNLK